MKASDLMINDWVMLTDPIHNGEKVQVKAIHSNGYVTVDGGIDNMLEPVPLTAEILEKNFEPLDMEGECFGLYDDYFEVEIAEYTDGLWQVQVNEIEIGNLPTWRMFVSNVNELQHALRLCNIEKTIEL